ncbi:condensation domain-containing protein [Streptomyces sp. M10(2022)]
MDGTGFEKFQQSVLVRVPAGATKERLTNVLQAVLNHHDVLRASLIGAVGDRSLHIAEPGAVRAADRLARVDVSGLDDAALRTAVTAGLHEAQELLDPSAGVMVRAVWFDAGTFTPGRLLLVLHHLVVDGVSWRILLPDLATAWEAVTAGRPITLPTTGTSFRRWAHLLTEEAQNPTRVKELPLWEKVLQEPEPLLGARQLDPARDTLGSATSLSWTLSTEQTTPLLTRVPSLYFCGVNDVLLTGLALAFGQWRSSRGADSDRSLLVDLEGHGRQDITDDVELSRTAGWFTNIYPARLDAGSIKDGPSATH